MPRKNKKEKTNNNNTQYSTIAKHGSVFKDLKSRLGWEDAALNEKTAEAIIEYLEEWLKKDTSIDMGSFYKEFGILERSWYKLLDRYPMLKLAHEDARAQIGLRRQQLMFFKKYNANPQQIFPTMRLYHNDYQKLWQDEADLKEKQNADHQPPKIEIVMKDFSNEKE